MPAATGMTPAAALATLNQSTPGTIAAGFTITLGSVVHTVQGDSIASVCSRFTPPATPAALAGAIGDIDGILAPGAVWQCPPGVLPAAPTGQKGVTPAEAGARFGLAPAALLAANAGNPSLILEGQTLVASSIDSAQETTAATDSLTAIVERFRRRNVTTDIGALVAANPTRFLVPSAPVLLPPATTALTAALGASPSGWKPRRRSSPSTSGWRFTAPLRW